MEVIIISTPLRDVQSLIEKYDCHVHGFKHEKKKKMFPLQKLQSPLYEKKQNLYVIVVVYLIFIF